jgi:hypothetical protein
MDVSFACYDYIVFSGINTQMKEACPCILPGTGTDHSAMVAMQGTRSGFKNYRQPRHNHAAVLLPSDVHRHQLR